jgi:uncharacterized protein with GYD domain
VWTTVSTGLRAILRPPTTKQKRSDMASYIVLMKWTDQGIKSCKDSPKRAEAFKATCEGLGVRLSNVAWTIGAYDVVGMLEGADDAVMTALLKLGSAGNVHTQTLRAYGADEFSKIVGKV